MGDGREGGCRNRCHPGAAVDVLRWPVGRECMREIRGSLPVGCSGCEDEGDWLSAGFMLTVRKGKRAACGNGCPLQVLAARGGGRG